MGSFEIQGSLLTGARLWLGVPAQKCNQNGTHAIEMWGLGERIQTNRLELGRGSIAWTSDGTNPPAP
ncbi:hypothetical protein SSBR45G_57630 [Bradyrhizobium sp. SSBR45G]|nr:hypothetical protein SSBR45G_57630 [Bradyrhizobium sp. SSBR45G]GLH88326.1 hypothetical protein SSBR45R_57870 [Bradyrhizobium sp. SSBR45R]